MGQGLQRSKELYLLTCIVFPFTGPASIIVNKGGSENEMARGGKALGGKGGRKKPRGREWEKTQVELVCLLTGTSRSQTILEQREGSTLGLCERDPDSMLWLVGRVSGSY